MNKLEEAETSRFILLYHMRRASTLIAAGNIAEASIILHAAIAVASAEDRAAIAKTENIATPNDLYLGIIS